MGGGFLTIGCESECRPCLVGIVVLIRLSSCRSLPCQRKNFSFARGTRQSHRRTRAGSARFGSERSLLLPGSGRDLRPDRLFDRPFQLRLSFLPHFFVSKRLATFEQRAMWLLTINLLLLLQLQSFLCDFYDGLAIGNLKGERGPPGLPGPPGDKVSPAYHNIHLPTTSSKGECALQAPAIPSESWVGYETAISPLTSSCKCNITDILSSSEFQGISCEDGPPGEQGPKGEKVTDHMIHAWKTHQFLRVILALRAWTVATAFLVSRTTHVHLVKQIVTFTPGPPGPPGMSTSSSKYDVRKCLTNDMIWQRLMT